MFISSHDGQLQIVYQYDHAVQAGQVTQFWGNDQFSRPARFESVCLAVSKHDIGWVEPDTEVLFDAEKGRAINFIDVDLRQHIAFYHKGYETVKAEDPYAGLLVGMHWIGLYTRRFGYDPTFTYKIPDELAAFVEETILNQQKEWVDIKMDLWDRQQPRSTFESELWMGYELVQIMDRLSQYVSLNTPDVTSKTTLGRMRTNLDGPYVTLTARGIGNGTVVVDPFPFNDVVETEVVLRRIPDKRYSSQEEVRKILNEAKREVVSWKFVP